MQLAAEEVTALLENLHGDKQQDLAELVPLLYAELRRLAAHYLRQERVDHTLQATALVHEAYLRMMNQREVQWENRNHFLGIAAQLMRRILVDYGRSRHAAKRAGNAGKVFLEEACAVAQERTPDVVALDAALKKLAELEPQQARIVELRFFGGLSIEEAANVLGISPATVKRNWNVSKAWLARELGHRPDEV
jgi:RNA polymerase sigma-70 factor (ECF subfamily)